MFSRINKFLDVISEYLAHRKGLLPILGILLVLVNFILQLVLVNGWIVQSDLFLHLGVILAIIGFLLAWAL
jgi:hypothetical protein